MAVSDVLGDFVSAVVGTEPVVRLLKNAWRRLWSLCVVTTFAVLPVNAAEIQLLSTDYAPYFSSDLPKGGPLTEIVVEAFAKVGHKVTIDFVPWARAMEQAKAGRVDGLHGAWHSVEREQWFIYSDPLPGNELVLFKRKGNPPQEFTGFNDLQPYTIGVVRAYRNPEAFGTGELRTDEADSDSANLMKLAKGRIDLVLIERAVADFLLATELADHRPDLEAIEPPVEILPLYVLLSRQIPEYAEWMDDFNRGLELLRNEGGVKEIISRHKR